MEHLCTVRARSRATPVHDGHGRGRCDIWILSPKDDTSWDDALKKVAFPFAKKASDTFRRRIEGSPQRRQFNSIYSGSPLGRMSIAFKKNYLKVYTVDQSPEAERIIRARLEPLIPVSRWGSESTKNSGFTFTVETPEQFAHFLKAVGESEG
jgi:hypothetical protein